jgi:hypothetical protein
MPSTPLTGPSLVEILEESLDTVLSRELGRRHHEGALDGWPSMRWLPDMVMMRRGARAVGERSHRDTPQELGYRRLGAAVIVSAVRDLEKPTRAGGESVRAGESARAFLTVSNSNLKFWCRVADVDMNAILRTYCQGGKVARIVGNVEPDEFDDFVQEAPSWPSRKGSLKTGTEHG